MSAQLGNWDDLRFFLAVARHGKLLTAANELGVNHSTVFRRIAALEERLGTRLFDRHAAGHALTAAGEEMRVIAERIEDEVLGLDRHVLGRDRELSGTVRVTCADFGVALAPYFRGFLETHPRVDLEVVIDNRVLSLHRREADVAIRPGGRPAQPDLVARKMAPLRSAVYAARNYLERHARPRRHTDLASHEIVAGDESLAHMPAARWLETHAGGARVRYRANTLYNQLVAVTCGAGIGVLPCYLGDAEPDLVRLFLPDDIEPTDIWLVYHGDLRQTARVRAFIDYFSERMIADAARFEGRDVREGVHRPPRP